MPRFLVIVLQLLFLLLGPAAYAYSVYAHWYVGYRTLNWNTYAGQAMLMGVVVLLWIVLVLSMILMLSLILYIASTNQQKAKHRKSSLMMIFLSIAILIAVLTAFMKGVGSGAFDEGRKAMQSEIDLRQLAEDCLSLRLKQVKPNQQVLWREEMNQAIAFSPAIQRLRPNTIYFNEDCVTLEFAGGFDHYGYQLIKDKNPGQWNLEWYTESSNEKLLSFTVPLR